MPVHDWTRVDAGIFHDFQLSWLNELKTSLNGGLLPPSYYALCEQLAGKIAPDVLTLQATENAEPPSPIESLSVKSIAVVEPAVRFKARSPQSYAARRRTVVIRHVSGDRVVALIEVVSPGNKSSRVNLQAFVSKAIAALSQGFHLLVADLFPPTSRDPNGIHGAIWAEIGEEPFVLPKEQPLTLASYASGLEITAYVQPVGLGESLPDMPLFLDAEQYVDVPLDRTYLSAWQRVPERWRKVIAGN